MALQVLGVREDHKVPQERLGELVHEVHLSGGRQDRKVVRGHKVLRVLLDYEVCPDRWDQ